MFQVCVDIGGTFTDCVVLDGEGNLSQFKAPTTPSDFAEGVLNALEEAAAGYGQTVEQFISEIELIVHGTTVATNALVTGNWARTAMITTRGFRDIIEIRRALKIETKSMYQPIIPPYEPIVPRYLRFVVDEETRCTGEIARPVDEDELKSVIRKIREEGVEAVAICFINAYTNPENERKAAQICNQEHEEMFVAFSSDVLPKMGEYERESTCVLNACLGPVVSRYLLNLERRLGKAGFSGRLLLMQANQLMQSVPVLARKPVYIIDSGPAAAPAGGAFLGKTLGELNLICIDIGGTTFDASLIRNGEVVLVEGKWLGDERLAIKVVDINSIGAGGGSIARLDSLGLLHVGPQSAAAEPGPACYGRGGKEPTLTDAAVLLGYIPSDYFLGGKLRLDVDLARTAVNKIADGMNMTIEKAAQAILTTVNSEMADAITQISTRKGYDLRDFSLLAVGGGGPLCGAFLAELLGIQKVIIPEFAASFSAWSMLSLDIGRDYLRPYICPLSAANARAINQLYEEMITEALGEFKALNLQRQDLIITKSADVRYLQQYHEVELALPAGDITSGDIEQIPGEFHKKHEELYTFSLPWVPVEFRNLRLIARNRWHKIEMSRIAQGTKSPLKALKRKRMCLFNGNHIETPIYDSHRLKSGNVIQGPAVIEKPAAAVVIPHGFRCNIDEYGNYIIKRTLK
jgi:N-methylhydantoinase A